jgi:hypothetical protein
MAESSTKAFRASVLVLFLWCCPTVPAGEPLLIPAIDGAWWTVAENPDLGPLGEPGQQPVDFAVWQAADGTWQLCSCIRKTRCGGNTRLFYRWEGQKLTDAHWQPRGVAMTAAPEYGEAAGGLQAPHVIGVAAEYYMFYGNWHGICLAEGRDGKKFERVLNKDGLSQLFTEDTPEMFANTRDPMVLKIGDRYYCYYTAYPSRQGAVYCRTSPDLKKWGPSQKVAYGGRAGTGPGSAECPHVVYRDPWFYLFRTQRYGKGAQTSVYRSKDPLDFGVNDDQYLVCTLPIAAPEIVRDQGQEYVAALLASLKGIQIGRLKWVPK